MGKSEFLDQFYWQPERKGRVALELEGFVTERGRLVHCGYDLACAFKHCMPSGIEIGYELPRAQIELRSAEPVPMREIAPHVDEFETALRLLEDESGFEIIARGYLSNHEAVLTQANEYEDISERLSPDALHAACSTAGLHAHVGLQDLEAALAAYERARGAVERLIEGYASTERLAAYKAVTSFWEPTPLPNAEALYALAQKQDFEHNLKRWWALIRISRHGTLEFRMADATRDRAKILAYAEACYALCNLS